MCIRDRFYLSGIVAQEQAIAKIKKSIEDTYGRKGRVIVERNWAAIDLSLIHI